MAKLNIEVPDSAFAIGVVAVTIDASGQPLFITAAEYPFDEYESLGKASLPTAVRRFADALAADAPKVVTLPAHDDEDWDDEDGADG